jgi:class 3 adenylate cyclase
MQTQTDPAPGAGLYRQGTLVTRTIPRADPVAPPVVGLPRYRAIVALDIEQSTSRPDPVKAELRRTLYELFDEALRSAGIHRRHRDRFTDRGDGLLALIRPADQAPKAVLLTRAVPALSRLLADYNAGFPRAVRPQRQLRIRAVVHAGDVHYDANGCFGETLDVAFRLLDAPGVKKTLRGTTCPLALVISGDIYRTVVRPGYDGIDQHAFRPLVRVHLAGHRYPGWIHVPHEAAQLRVAEMASYRQPA